MNELQHHHLDRPRRSRALRRATAVALAATVGLAVACTNAPPAVPEPEPALGVPVPDPSPEVRGYLDAHNHLFSDIGFGGGLLCGKVFDPDGIAAALKDCPDHQPNGELALFENVTRHGTLAGTHDPTGWPTFADWPANDSLTHQQNYFEWIQRAWEGGLRVMVNDLVTNRQLCALWPASRLPCDEMDSLRRQARATRDLEAYIDGLHGGPGKGWFRVVESSEEARSVIAEGKLAVILGVEASEPFGCKLWNGRPTCTEEDVDRGLDELHHLGVRSMFICHKFDNALCGVRFDSDAIGIIINVANKISTNRFWQVEACPGDAHDHTIGPVGSLPQPLSELLRPGDLPLYPEGPHCNPNGLTDLGRHAIEGMIERNMLIEIDHMSAKAAEQTLSILEEADYPGVVSSHSWTDQTYLSRIYALGGMVSFYDSAATDFVGDWERTEALRDRHGVKGLGIGSDANGFGGLPPAPSGDRVDPVKYPFTALDGRTLDKASTGLRQWDYNAEGMAHYGLMPDWIEDMRTLAGAPLVDDLAHGAEQYLQTLGSAEAHG
jgi:microsomal dipeptidase-like Zn-dependent dipeptidase